MKNTLNTPNKYSLQNTRIKIEYLKIPNPFSISNVRHNGFKTYNNFPKNVSEWSF